MISSVEWLWDKCVNESINISDVVKLFEQAKAMHKDEIITAHSTGRPIEDGVFTAIDKGHKYYNETYNKTQ
jgi:hypothetical protein